MQWTSSTRRAFKAAAAYLAVLTLGSAFAPLAHAGCADFQPSKKAVSWQTPASFFGGLSLVRVSDEGIPLPEPRHLGEHDGIVGTWLVNYGGVGQAFIQWHSDGTEWENITHPSAGGNICMGSWVATAPRTYYRNHFGWIFDSKGLVAGYFNETETDVLAKDGKTYTGTNTTIFYDMTGHEVPAPGAPPPAPSGGYPGTAWAIRIVP
jgi:hypothetical protein